MYFAMKGPYCPCAWAAWLLPSARERDEHPRRYALVAALPPRRGHKLVSLDSDDDAFDGDSDDEEVAVQLAAQRRQALAQSLSAAKPQPPRGRSRRVLRALPRC